jgi:hypothetical protein
MAKTFNLKNKPTKKSQITKDSMKNYILSLAQAEDTSWYINLVEKNTEIKTLTKDGVETKKKKVDWVVIKEEFIKKYFPYLIVAEKDEYLDDLKVLLADIEDDDE